MDTIFIWEIVGTFAIYVAFLDVFNGILKALTGDHSQNSNIVRLFSFLIYAIGTSAMTYFIWWWK